MVQRGQRERSSAWIRRGFPLDDMNLYRYVGGDPVNGTDPTGDDGSSSGGGPPVQLIAGVNASISQSSQNGSSQGPSSSSDLLDNATNLISGWADSAVRGPV